MSSNLTIMGDEERRDRPRIDPELEGLLQTPEGRSTVAGVWAIQFAESSHNLNFGTVADKIKPGVTRGVDLLTEITGRIRSGQIQAHQEFQGQSVIQRLENTYLCDDRVQGHAQFREELGLSGDELIVVDRAAKATAKLNGELHSGLWEKPKWKREGDLDRFSLEFGGLIIATQSRPEPSYGLVSLDMCFSDELNPTPRIFHSPDARAEPSNAEHAQEIQKDAEYMAKVGGALQLLEARLAELFFVKQNRLPPDWTDERRRFDKAVRDIKKEFLMNLGFSYSPVFVDSDGDKARQKFRSELIETGYLDQLKKSQTKKAETQPEESQQSETGDTNPDQQLLTELAVLDGALQGRRVEAGSAIEQLKSQVAQWEAYKGHLDAASDRLKQHQEKLSTAAVAAEAAAKIKELIGADPQARSYASGRAVLELGAGAAQALLTGIQTDQLLSVVRDQDRFTSSLRDLYQVPEDQADALKQAVAEAAQVIRPSLDMPAAFRGSLVGVVQAQLAGVAEAIGVDRLEKGRSGIGRLLNLGNVQITDYDREQIQSDVIVVRGLLGQAS